MVLMPKEPGLYPPMRIYRGTDPTRRELPIQKTEDAFEKMDGFGGRMKWALKQGLIGGLAWSVADIYMFSRLTDRRVQIARTAYFTLPAVTAACGWMALLEISKRMLGREHYQTAYVSAAVAPASVFSVWRKRPQAFPKVFAVAAIVGFIYQKSVDEDLIWGGSATWQNPNDPYGFWERSWSLFGEARRPEFRPDGRIAMYKQMSDPGPTYAKFEEK